MGLGTPGPSSPLQEAAIRNSKRQRVGHFLRRRRLDFSSQSFSARFVDKRLENSGNATGPYVTAARVPRFVPSD